MVRYYLMNLEEMSTQADCYNKGVHSLFLGNKGPMAYQRWYDADPALSQALASLRGASDKYQAQLALNIILIIVEHQIEGETLTSVDDLIGVLSKSKQDSHGRLRRWYDLNATLRSAMQLLHDCPDNVQQTVIGSIGNMIDDFLAKNAE